MCYTFVVPVGLDCARGHAHFGMAPVVSSRKIPKKVEATPVQELLDGN